MLKLFRICVSSILILGLFLAVQEPSRPARAARLNSMATNLAKSSAAPAASLTCTQPIRIMPLGDSITRGRSSVSDPPGSFIAYRRDLYLSLTAKGYQLNFVGSSDDLQNDGSAYTDFDRDHEGWGGERDEYIAEHVFDWLTVNPADIVLLHIGTNDMNQPTPDIDPSSVEAILDEIDMYDEGILVIVARIIDQVPHDPDTVTFNDNVETMLDGRTGDLIWRVNMETGAGINYAVYPAGDMLDQLHPHATGYTKMAAEWEQALVNSLPFCARDDSVSIQEDSGTTTINVLDNDGGDNIAIQTFIPDPGNAGTVEFDTPNQNFKYTPPNNFIGTDSFTYSITDGPAGSDTQAVVTVNVTPSNDPPTISAIADQTIYEDTSTGPISFTIGDSETPVNNLSLSATSSDPAVVPNGNITFSGSGSSRTVAVMPAANQNTPGDPVTITIRVRDAGNLEAASSFKLTVIPVNDPPVVRFELFLPGLFK
jgi:lysophospholipase L1-like esterase